MIERKWPNPDVLQDLRDGTPGWGTHVIIYTLVLTGTMVAIAWVFNAARYGKHGHAAILSLSLAIVGSVAYPQIGVLEYALGFPGKQTLRLLFAGPCLAISAAILFHGIRRSPSHRKQLFTLLRRTPTAVFGAMVMLLVVMTIRMPALPDSIFFLAYDYLGPERFLGKYDDRGGLYEVVKFAFWLPVFFLSSSLPIWLGWIAFDKYLFCREPK
jgi:hypothetical protein